MLSATPLARYEYSGGGAVVSHVDISERRQAESERDRLLDSECEARETAEAANRAKDEFLAIVSHELRTPLHSILGWVKLLGEDDLDEDTKRQAIEIIVRNVGAQAQLVNDMLDVSRIVTGKMSHQPVFLELHPVAQFAVEIMEPQARLKNIILETDLSNSRVLGDAARLQQAFWNLIQNAIKFSPDGATIRILLQEVGDRARFSVIDNGVGIASEFLPLVFNRFQQVTGGATREHGGLGLGLAITRHLVELHGGTIEVFSEGLGKGSTFVVELPLLNESEIKQTISTLLTDDSPIKESFSLPPAV